ncbi:WD40 repeat-like protein [Aureobasidium pullulans]|nr:WD40 repeat-like protein [Aureobasidium pullulans]
MFDTICTLPLSSELFAQALHPTNPLVAVGLSSGHVATLRLPPVEGDDEDDAEAEAAATGRGQVEAAWRTRRHKGSCRSLGYSLDGSTLFSAGTDGIVKGADSVTGKVVTKIAIPHDPATDDIDEPSILHILSPQTFLLATDSSALHLYDTREANFSTFSSTRHSQTHHPHEDYISSLTPLPASETSTSGYSKQWVTTGGTTLSVTDLRRGVLVRSEDQEEILLSSCFVSGLPARKTSSSKGEKLVVGGGDGVLTLWERGVWDDQDERITVDRSPGGGESLDVIRVLPPGVGPGGKVLAVGMGDGKVRFVKLGPNKVISEITHDEVEGVVSLDFDVAGRLITAGGSTIKVWHEMVDEDQHAYVDGDLKREAEGSDADSDKDDDSDMGSDDSSDEEETGRKRRKKRKRSKGKDKSGGKSMGSFGGLD